MKKNAEFNSNANIDKSNRSVMTKSSKLTKKNVQVEKAEMHYYYFQKGKIGDKVLQRTSASKSKEKAHNHLDKAGKIIQDLMSRHRKAKQKLQKLKQQAQKQYDKQHPFTPKKNKIQRYHVSGDVIRRNEIWLREKKKKQLQLKQTVILEDLRQCTFSPSFSSKKQSQSYLKHRDMLRSLTPKHNTTNEYLSRNSNRYSQMLSSKKDFTKAEYQMAKNNLISKIMTAIK